LAMGILLVADRAGVPRQRRPVSGVPASVGGH
jgi:hypothetical protein